MMTAILEGFNLIFLVPATWALVKNGGTIREQQRAQAKQQQLAAKTVHN